jgi:thiol-disulfide isomerase/thioredoxin
MKLVCLGLATLLASPALAQTSQLAGTITGLGGKPLLYQYMRQGKRLADTVRVAASGQFAHPATAGDDGMGSLYVAGASRFVSFWVEPGTMRVQGDAAQPGKIRVTGTPENDVLDEYCRTVDWKYDATTAKSVAAFDSVRQLNSQATRQFIKAHPAARTSAYELYWQTLTQPKYPVGQYVALAQQLTPAVRQSPPGQLVAKRLLILQSQPTVGRPVADFTIADTAGVKHSLATYRGQYVLLDFWGHWCSPCLKAMPKVKALHQQYGSKLAIIGIGMEAKSDQAIWKKTIRKYEVPGLQLSELQADEGPVISGYNVTAFPTYMLLDPKGMLVMSTNDVDDITKKLTALSSF